MTKCYGLIGYPLGHSFSKAYFTEKFKSEHIHAAYDLYPITNMDQLLPMIEKLPELCGLNVTIPYKQQVIPFLDSISDEAASINAVNTISIIRKDDKISLTGWNTDAPAFEEQLISFAGGSIPAGALIIGTGGAAAAVAFVLKKLHCNFRFVSRHPQGDDQISYDMVTADRVNQTPLIINATPLGMFPKTDAAPLFPYHALNANHLLFDLIYNPAETQFMALSKQYGAKVCNGLGMLHKQAELAWNIWQSDFFIS